MTDAGVRVGVDIGGTFTDVIALNGDRVQVTKVLSTPADLSQGVMDGISRVLDELTVAPTDVDVVVHATTAATNALLERKGARVGLLVTAGFGDILEIARQRRPDAYDLFADKLPPLVPRRRVVEIPERLAADGSVITALDERAVRTAWSLLAEEGVEALAVAFLHAYANPDHEQRTMEILRTIVPPEVPVFGSHEVLSEAREFERTSTTVIAAYLSQITSGYQRTLALRLRELGMPPDFWVMKSSGGLVTSGQAAAHPEELVESGPAAGVIVAAGMGRRLGLPDVISFDMGGTTAKASLVLGGNPNMTWDYEVGGVAHTGSFLQRGSGHPLRVPVIDLAEVGTGGGSLARIDEAGALRVGPESAGADPGPACYGRGGTRPTVTDADAVLGYLDVSGSQSDLGRLDAGAAREAIRREIAEPLGLSVEAAAAGIFQLANAQMAGAVRLVSMAKGYDPRSFALIAFGGAGPVHAWAVARELGISRVIVPPYAGVNSAVGLLQAEFRVDLSRGYRVETTDRENAGEMAEILAELSTEARRALIEQGQREEAVHVAFSADMRYVGQSYDVLVDFPNSPHDLAAVTDAFHAEHQRAYGHSSPDAGVEVTVLRVSATAPGVGFDFEQRPDGRLPGSVTTRLVRFDDTEVEASVHRRSSLEAAVLDGPVLVDENDTTIVVPPGARATSASGFVTLHLESEATVA